MNKIAFYVLGIKFIILFIISSIVFFKIDLIIFFFFTKITKNKIKK